MILKVQDKKQGDWHVWGEIVRFSKHRCKDNGTVPFDTDFAMVMNEEEKKKHKGGKDWVTVVTFRQKGIGEEYSARFNTWGYLCNDEGKTIEKV